METDVGATSEYADIYFDGSLIDRCADGSYTDTGCSWIHCDGPTQRQTASSPLNIELRYSPPVDNFAVCTYNNGHTSYTGYAITRITVTWAI